MSLCNYFIFLLPTRTLFSLYSLQTWYMQGTASKKTFSWLHRQFIAVEFSSPIFTDKLLMFNWKNKRKYVERDCRTNAFIDGWPGWDGRAAAAAAEGERSQCNGTELVLIDTRAVGLVGWLRARKPRHDQNPSAPRDNECAKITSHSIKFRLLVGNT